MTIIPDSVPNFLTNPRLFTALEPSRMMVEMSALTLATPLLTRQRAETGHPFLVVTGAVSMNFGTRPMRQALKRMGHFPHTPPEHTMYHTPKGTYEIIVKETEKLAEQYGEPITIVGWCVGGAFTRMTAHTIPDKVRQVINLGSARSGAIYPKELKYAGRDRLPVPSTVVYSRTDGMNDWRNVVEDPGPQTENIEVLASHWGMANNPFTVRIIADRLSQPLGTWAPYHRSNGRATTDDKSHVRVA